MTLPALSFAAPSAIPTGAPLVLGVVKGSEGPELIDPTGLRGAVQALLVPLALTGAAEELTRIPDPAVAGGVLVLIGLGTEVSPAALRKVAGAAVRRLAGAESVVLALPTPDAAALAGVAEGALLGAYTFTEYRVSTLAGRKSPVASVTVVTELESGKAGLRAEALAASIALVKDLVNTPPLDLYPETMAERAIEASSGLGLGVTVWDEKELAAEGFGGIGGVGQGSPRPPRLVKVAWTPEGATTHLALVGKGITFDTGGNSIKSAPGMIGMKYDMTGAATALGVVLAAARLALPVRVTAWLCIAENMPGGSALRPNDVITVRGGKTVEVLNTDAEGRLVLADGLVAAGEEQPDQIIDIATLTGAAKAAMGTRYIPVMGDGPLVSSLMAAAEESGESMWHMPLPDEMRGMLDSEVADIANIKPGLAGGGMLIAGVFLREFSTISEATGEPIPWAHLDIAGTAWTDSGTGGFTTAGPTAVTVRTLLRHAERLAGA